MPNFSTKLDTISQLTRLLQRGPLVGQALQEAVGLAAQCGDVGAALLKEALAADAVSKPRPPLSVTTCPAPPPPPPCPDDCVDTTPPQTPYTRLFFGEFVDRQPPPDPLVIRMSRLEKDASVWFINRRNHLDADRADKATWQAVPWDGSLDAEGNANVVISDKQVAALCIEGGDVLEIFQTDKAGNVSGSDWVAINERSPGGRIENPIGRGPTTWLGVQSTVQRPQFLMRGDGKAPAANGEALTQSLRNDGRWQLTLRPAAGKLALEPFSKVVVDQPPFVEGHYTHEVKRDGSFEIKTSDAAPHDAVVLRVLDHSTGWKMGEGAKLTERRVVLAAGVDGAVVVENPAAGTTKAIAASLGRITLSRELLVGEAGAATPGSIVAVVDQSTGKRYATAVGPDGSFSRPLSSSVGNQLSVQLLHAFDAPARRVDLGTHEVGCDARALDSASPAVGNNDAGALRLEIDDLTLSFSTYDWNTGNDTKLALRSDWSGSLRSVTRFDADKGEVVVRVGVLPDGRGVRRDELSATGVLDFFGAPETSPLSQRNPEIGVLRGHVAAAGEGGSLPVRFEADDGRVLQRGRLAVSSVLQWHSTGAMQKDHPVWKATLVPGSLVAA